MALDQVDVDKQFPDEKNMGFFDHLDELRKRLVRIAYAVLLTTIVAFFWVEDIFDLIILSPFKADFLGYRFFCKMGRLITHSDSLCWPAPKLSMQSQQIQGQFVSAFKIAFVVGIVVAFPYIVYQIWGFVKPALSLKELKKTKRSLFVVSFLFFTGVLFS